MELLFWRLLNLSPMYFPRVSRKLNPSQFALIRQSACCVARCSDLGDRIPDATLSRQIEIRTGACVAIAKQLGAWPVLKSTC